ncbi:YqhG family protein [Paenibacillus turicensis]|uniref:YqhG family protein n=1 Tax=Paenibacillus turicensis TaxID=160487 RepID=UPI003D2B566B
MTMSSNEIREYVVSYLESTQCQFIENSPWHVTVKLSPQADRELTDRPYYWGFVDRMNIEPETMSFSFVFDPEGYDEMNTNTQPTNTLGVTSGQPDLLNRYYGSLPPLPVLGPGRIRREDIHFGSARLRQIFNAVKQSGSCVYLFEDPGPRQKTTLFPASYEPWLAVCWKVEFACDLKREELHFHAISLASGKIDTSFDQRIMDMPLLQRLPENIHIGPTSLSLRDGHGQLEQYLYSSLEKLDTSWATSAKLRLQEELELVDAYYKDLLLVEDEERQAEVKAQLEARRSEITWQYEPRIMISAINCGIFHLREDSFPRIDRNR